MATLSSWLERIAPLAGLGNAGAVANAGRACDERRQIEAATDEALRQLSARLAPDARPARQTA
jgi:hypothetical protein